jgi:hypothetical protein
MNDLNTRSRADDAAAGLVAIARMLGSEIFEHIVTSLLPHAPADESPPLGVIAGRMFAKARKAREKANLLERVSHRRNRREVAALRREAAALERQAASAQKARVDAAWADNATVETAKLAALRGEIVEIAPRVGPSRSPARRVSGVDWLLLKNKLDSYQHQAAERYATDYSVASEVSLPGGFRDAVAGGGAGGGDGAHIRRSEAQRRLTSARAKGLRGHVGMIALCDVVVGDGKRIRQISNDEAQAAKNEAVLIVALDLLVEYYGIL